MLEKKNCPRCGQQTATTLACEFCGYRFQAKEGEVEIGVPGGIGRPLRLKLGGLLTVGGGLVLTMCICPQTWLVGGAVVDRGLGIKSGFWSFSNAAAAAVIACPVTYGVALAITLIVIGLKRRAAS
jgi:hypothetical protein